MWQSRKYCILHLLACLIWLGVSGCQHEGSMPISVNSVVLPNNVVEQGTLYVVLIGDTNAHDIQASIQSNIDNMEILGEQIAAHTGLQLNELILTGNKVTFSGVETAVKELTAGPNDRVIFYYSGRGQQPTDQKARWPRMYFTSDSGGDGMDFNEVFVRLTRKNPQFLLMLTDPCYRMIGAVDDPWDAEDVHGLVNAPSDAYRALFVNTRGSIIAAGARPEEEGMGSQFGGLFTQQFLYALHNGLMMDPPDWQTILTQATWPVAETQNPYYTRYE